MTDFLVPLDQYLACGVHIGTRQSSGDMRRYVYKIRDDGLNVLNVRITDTKIRAAANLIARYEPDRVLVVSTRQYGVKPVKTFAEITGAFAISGRFVPGTLTNPQIKEFIEPKIVLITDPIGDIQVIKEALKVKIPIVALCDTNNDTKYIDLIIPANNKGKGSLALVYYLLAREILRARGEIAKDAELEYKVEDFQSD